MTPHNKANKEDIARIVIMPGDPKRAKFITENYLENYKLVNDVRGMLAYTGEYKGNKITVMASGMGMPSIGIYSYELFKFYDVDVIIRVGSMGAYDESLDLYDVVVATESYSDSSYAKVQSGREDNVILSDKTLNEKILETAKENNIKVHSGRVYATDVFYHEESDIDYMNKTLGCLGTEMETFALFHNANVCNKKATAIITVSDHLRTGKETTPEERETAFRTMMELALDSSLKM